MSHHPIRLAVAVAAVVLGCQVSLTTGCRTARPPVTTTESFQPMYDRAEVHNQLQRSRRISEREGGVEQRVAHAAVQLWEALEALYAAPPEVAVEAREREADVISRYLRAVEAASRAVEAVDPAADPPLAGIPVEVSFRHYLDALARAEADGRYDDAIAVAQTLLDEIEESGEPLLQTTRLRLWIGLWHLALGEYGEARAAFGAVQELRAEGDDLAERARLLVEELDLLQTLPPGAERDDLARGWALLETGDLDRAGALARQVQQRSGDADLQREASFLVAAVQRSQAAWVEDLERRARVDITDGPPFELARECARTLESGPEPAPSRARQVLAAVDEAEVALAAVTSATVAEQWTAAGAEARTLVAAERFREAAALYDRFQGTELEDRARDERTRTLDILVREQRRHAGDLFVAAQSESDPARRTALLAQARQILQGLIEEFPESSYADRVRKNLVAVDQALDADPG